MKQGGLSPRERPPTCRRQSARNCIPLSDVCQRIPSLLSCHANPATAHQRDRSVGRLPRPPMRRGWFPVPGTEGRPGTRRGCSSLLALTAAGFYTCDGAHMRSARTQKRRILGCASFAIADFARRSADEGTLNDEFGRLVVGTLGQASGLEDFLRVLEHGGGAADHAAVDGRIERRQA